MPAANCNRSVIPCHNWDRLKPACHTRSLSSIPEISMLYLCGSAKETRTSKSKICRVNVTWLRVSTLESAFTCITVDVIMELGFHSFRKQIYNLIFTIRTELFHMSNCINSLALSRIKRDGPACEQIHFRITYLEYLPLIPFNIILLRLSRSFGYFLSKSFARQISVSVSFFKADIFPAHSIILWLIYSNNTP
jgi:hypothetical protein